ncbi:two-component regulator propeller domain-containing protein [Flammeovirga kamogawensis]|uniref:Two component regulator three Y domain-containing protein n=1 Tax=Flammeovirga kamogawensis TaxID=373891 RepID=A0ABX8GYX0_9BACT|nr:two-component regulator propeller domain-containing protein [Flammeovirga kamogawensis]MBB6460782.1 ligand-binding sensor domain-containing protein/DNA-binding CsgD family transcriptional regulator [Flammeovirga kamogawensis]QWG08135.1 hypothetical protein KM029_04135 [Flammeovirga kamogawensis]TRX69938.1 hypothetical protein EO216_18075 [Flammeovirga kamogawensis]
MKATLLTNFALGFLFLNVIALTTKAKDLKPIKLSSFSTKNGLSQNNVNDILYDKYGFLWIGTDDGLNKFDGHSFQKFTSNSINGLSFSSIRCLKNDPVEDKLWIGTNGSLEVYDFETKIFTKVKVQNKHSVEDIKGITWCNSKQWIAINHIGLFVKDKSSIEYQKIEGTEGAIQSIAAFRKLLFLATDKGLVTFSNNNYSEVSVPTLEQFKKKNIFILKRIKNQLFVGTKDGSLFLIDSQLKAQKLYSGKNKIKTIALDHNQNIWIGTEGNGIILLEKAKQYKSFTLLHHKSNGKTINYIYKGVENNIWIGTFGDGLQLYNESDPFFLFTEEKTYSLGLSHNSVTSITEVKENELFVGTDGGGVDKVNLKNGKIENILSNKFVISLEKNDDKVWVGKYHDGLAYFDKNQKIHPFTLKDQFGKSLSTDNIWDIQFDLDNNMWLATTVGVIKYNQNTEEVTRYLHHNSIKNTLSNNDTRKVYLDIKGDIWIGSFNGLNKYNKIHDNFEQLYLNQTKNDSLNTNNAIISICEDNNFNLWIGTFGNGLWKLDRQTDTFSPATINQQLPNQVIYSIENDLDGILWLSTNRGLVAFNSLENTIRCFSAEDGLQGKQFNVGASFLLNNGNLAFGGTEGLNVFNGIKAMHFLQENPNVKVTSLTLYNEFQNANTIDISNQESLELAPHHRTFSLGFVGLDYNYHHNIEYRYRLKGFEEHWHKSKSTKTVIYSNLLYGNYWFEVQCRYKGQNWGELTKIEVLLQSNYWETLYFKLSIALLIALGLVGIYYIYVRNLKKQKEMLDQMVKERSQALLAKEMDILEMNNQKAELIKEALAMREKELTTHALRLVHLNTLIDHIDKKLESIQKSPEEFSPSKINSIRREIKEVDDLEKDWKVLNSLFAEVHKPFIETLTKTHPTLTEGNIRMCYLIKLNMSSKDIASIMGISSNSVKVARKRLRKRLELESDDSLEDYITKMGQ